MTALLGNDLLGFHLRYHCQNFLDTVDRTVEAKVDYERFEITHGGKVTHRAAISHQHRCGRPRGDGGQRGGR